MSSLMNVPLVEILATRAFVPPTGLQLKKSHDCKIMVHLIDDSPYQQRMLYDADELDNLAQSLRSAGQTEPIRVRESPGGRYELVAGHRRTRAARNIGWEQITAEIIKINDREAKMATMVSNEARVDLTDYERGKMYQAAIIAGFAVTQGDIGKLFGTSQANVSRRMAMLRLSSTYLRLLDDKPDMFGAKCAAVITQLIEEYPDEQTLIEHGVMRIIEEQADQNSVKPWVKQMMKQRAQHASENRPKVITNRTGRQTFTTRREGQVITIRISDQDIDPDMAMEKLADLLRQISDQDEKNKVVENQ